MALIEWPWRAIFEGGIWRVVGPDGVVADLGSDQGDDAVLMASAPELLARVDRLGGACREVASVLDNWAGEMSRDADRRSSSQARYLAECLRAAMAGDGEVSGRAP